MRKNGRVTAVKMVMLTNWDRPTIKAGGAPPGAGSETAAGHRHVERTHEVSAVPALNQEGSLK